MDINISLIVAVKETVDLLANSITYKDKYRLIDIFSAILPVKCIYSTSYQAAESSVATM